MAKPATSCHLKYGIESNLSNQWTIQRSAGNVQRTSSGNFMEAKVGNISGKLDF